MCDNEGRESEERAFTNVHGRASLEARPCLEVPSSTQAKSTGLVAEALAL